jgi:DNA repair protein RecO (recombination protein O)
MRNQLELVSNGMYLAELVDGFGAEGSTNPELYHLFVETLRALDRGAPLEMVLRYFELQILKTSGFMPELHLCVECREELRPGSHLFSPEAGGTVCPLCARMGQRVYQLSVPALKVLRFFSRSTLEGASGLRADTDLGQELKTLLSTTLRYWLDKEIHSKAFLEHLGNSRIPGV